MSCHPFFSAAWFVLAWELMPKCGLRGSGNADAADANTFSASTGLISWNPYPTPSGSASVPPSSREPNTGTRPARRLRSQELCPVQEFKARIRSGNSHPVPRCLFVNGNWRQDGLVATAKASPGKIAGGRFRCDGRNSCYVLALALWIKDSRRWVKWVGGAAVLAVVAQALLGGITVLFYLPVAISTSHATLAQIFFCLAASLAFFTRADWRWDEPKLEDASTPSLQHLTLATTGIILVQLILGAVYRHSGMGIEPHVVGAGVVTMFVAYVVTRIVAKFPQTGALLRPALLLGSLLVLQVFLGIGSYIVKMADRNAPQPLPPVVDLTTAHLAVGALVLVTSLYLTYQTHRFLATRVEEAKIASAPHGAAI